MLRLDAHATLLELRLSPKAFHNAVAHRLSADQRHPTISQPLVEQGRAAKVRQP